MNEAQFERLLNSEEGTTLDFKKEQYRFARASDEEKSELLKDILGFVNASRDSEAYILIGVEDIRGGRSNVVGIPATDHLDDHSLQQFVTNLTIRPIHFHYAAFGFEGKQVGIIRIEEQDRPNFLKKNYGKLKKNEVYVRRGSSTDPTKPAGPDEIFQMGRESRSQDAELLVEFADAERQTPLGNRTTWDAELCEMPSQNSIPDLPSGRFPSPLDQTNADYFRELANFEFCRRLLRLIRLSVKNVGQVTANSVHIELTIPANIGAMVLDPADHPDLPRRHTNWRVSPPGLAKTRPAFRRSPGEVVIDKNNERFQVEIDCGDLQPGRRVVTDAFYIGQGGTGELPLSGQVFAENLPQPKDFTLIVSANVTHTTMSLAQLVALPAPKSDD